MTAALSGRACRGVQACSGDLSDSGIYHYELEGLINGVTATEPPS